MNESSEHTVRHLTRENKFLESDSDEQLLIHLPLQLTKIRAIRLQTNSNYLKFAPKKIKFFVNAGSTLGFDDAETLEVAQEIELTEA